jgi:hypothetical protein
MRPNGDESTTQQRLTVPEAAKTLALTSEAVRSRVRRGTLASERSEDGTLYVLVAATRSDAPTDLPHDQTLIVERLDSEVRFLREELIRREETFKYREETFRQLEEAWREESRRNDHIIAALTQRIPELEAAPEPRESVVSDSEDTGKGDVPQQSAEDEIKRSWWRRFFGA